MKLAAEGKLHLDDPLQRYAPRGKKVPQVDGAPAITLLNLATHTAGLPREVGAYPRKTPHFTFPDENFHLEMAPPPKARHRPRLCRALLQRRLRSARRCARLRFRQILRAALYDRITWPLKLWDTTLVPNQDQCARLLQGTWDEGPCTDTQASGASGGVYSTPADMARLLQYLLQIPGSAAQPKAAFTVYKKPADLKSVQGLSHAGDPTGIGAGWIQLGDPASPSMVMQKTGGGAGFQTYVALNLKRQTGIFFAATDGKGASMPTPKSPCGYACNNLTSSSLTPTVSVKYFA